MNTRKGHYWIILGIVLLHLILKVLALVFMHVDLTAISGIWWQPQVRLHMAQVLSLCWYLGFGGGRLTLRVLVLFVGVLILAVTESFSNPYAVQMVGQWQFYRVLLIHHFSTTLTALTVGGILLVGRIALCLFYQQNSEHRFRIFDLLELTFLAAVLTVWLQLGSNHLPSLNDSSRTSFLAIMAMNIFGCTIAVFSRYRWTGTLIIVAAIGAESWLLALVLRGAPVIVVNTLFTQFLLSCLTATGLVLGTLIVVRWTGYRIRKCNKAPDKTPVAQGT